MTLMRSGLQSRFSTILVLLIALSLATPYQRLSAEQATVLSVSDGDTVVLQIASNRERVRLIGIDTPESHSNPRAKKQAARNHQDVLSIIEQGKAAALYTRNLLPRGTSVRIEHDVEKRDHYGRVLAYLWLPSGEMVNEKIITSGYAYPLTIAPNVRYQERFLKAFHEARNAKRGLWAR
jgi:micrococcal nuclease